MCVLLSYQLYEVSVLFHETNHSNRIMVALLLWPGPLSSLVLLSWVKNPPSSSFICVSLLDLKPTCLYFYFTASDNRLIISNTWNRTESYVNTCLCHVCFFFPSFLIPILSTMFLPTLPKLINLVRNKELFRVGSNSRVQIHSKTYVLLHSSIAQ